MKRAALATTPATEPATELATVATAATGPLLIAWLAAQTGLLAGEDSAAGLACLAGLGTGVAGYDAILLVGLGVALLPTPSKRAVNVRANESP